MKAPLPVKHLFLAVYKNEVFFIILYSPLLFIQIDKLGSKIQETLESFQVK